MDNNFITIYKNPKYKEKKTVNSTKNSNEENTLELSPNEYFLPSPFQELEMSSNNLLKDNSPNNKENFIENIKNEIYEVLPPFQQEKMYTLNKYSSGIGELKIRVDSLQPVQIVAMIELTKGGQLLLPNDSIKRHGLSINNNNIFTLNLSYIKKIKRLSLITLDNINGVMVTENTTLDWAKTTQLNNINRNTILLNIYNIFGKIIIREGLEYYSQNLRELAFYNSYKKINWLDENTPINNTKEF